MKSRLVLTALTLLLLLPYLLQPCVGQDGGQKDSAAAQSAAVKYDAPDNDMLLFSSECGFRVDATRKVMPDFPEEALAAGAQGAVVLSLYHDSQGNAAKIKVVESPQRALTEAAIKAVKQWKWRLFMSGGIDRPILGKLSFVFIIEDGAGRVEDLVNDCDTSRDNWSLREIRALRLRATWPEESSSKEP
jgi:TonB family protein